MQLEQFRHQMTLEIRFGDLDAFGHVNNARYLSYMETARVRYMRDLNMPSEIPPVIGPIIAKITIEYLQPLMLDDERAQVYTRVARIGNSSYEVEQVVTCQRAGQTVVAASATVIGVMFDYRQQRSTRISDEWRAVISAYEPALKNS